MPTPRRLRTLAIATLVSAAVLAGPALAVTPATQAALDGMATVLAEIVRLEPVLRGALTDDEKALRDGVAPGSLVADATALSQNVLAVARATKGVDKADFEAPTVKSAFDTVQNAKRTLVLLGYAAPRAFLTPSGQSVADGFWSNCGQVERYKAEIDGPRANGALHDIENHWNRARHAYNRMSVEDKVGANGQAMTHELSRIQGYMEHTRAKWEATEQREAEAEQFCKDVIDPVVNGRGLFAPLQNLIGLKLGEASRYRGVTLTVEGVDAWLARIAKVREVQESLAPRCDDADQVALLEHCEPTRGEARLDGLYADQDPVVWCSVLDEAGALMAEELTAHAANQDAISAKWFDRGDLETKEGFISDDLLEGWSDLLEFGPDKQAEAVKPFQPLVEALGLTLEDIGSVFAQRVAAADKLRAEVERLAPTWGLPEKGSSHYGVGLAHEQVTRVFKGSRVVTSAASKGEWVIHKNGLDIPQHRDRGGWVLFQARGEPFCQLRHFYIREQWDGRGYQKDDAVTFGSVRWQSCS